MIKGLKDLLDLFTPNPPDLYGTGFEKRGFNRVGEIV